GPQRGDLLLQRGDVLDLRFEPLDLGAEHEVAALLFGDLGREPQVAGAGDQDSGDGRRAQRGVERFAPALACRLPVRHQVDQDHCRNLRMASPHEVRYEGASRRTFFSRTLSANCMPWKGSARAQGKDVWAVIASLRPG